MPGSDARGAVPPPGMTAAGKANSFAVPNWMNRKAAMSRSTLSRAGARLDHRATAVDLVTMPPRPVGEDRHRGSCGMPEARAHVVAAALPKRGRNVCRAGVFY